MLVCLRRYKVLGVALLLSGFTIAAFAAGSQEEEVSPGSGSDTSAQVTLEYSVPGGNVPPDNDQVQAFYEDKFNVDLSFKNTPWGDYMQAMNLSFASGDIPDVFYFLDSNRNAVLNTWINDGLIVDIAELLEMYPGEFPNLEAHLAAHPAAYKLFGDGGSLPVVPLFFGYVAGHVVVRQDLLDEYGYEMPETYDEFRDVAQAIIENDPDITTGFSGWNPVQLRHFTMGFFGPHNGDWTRHNGEYEYTPFVPGYRESLRYLNGLYEDGIIDPEFGIANRADVYSRYIQGRTFGSWITGNANHYGRLIETAEEESNIDSAYLNTLEGPAGRFRPRNHGFLKSIAISADTTQQERVRILSMIDYLHSEEGRETVYWGIEGVHYTMENGERQIIEAAYDRDIGSNHVSEMKHLGESPVYRNDAFAPEPVLQAMETVAEDGVPNNLIFLPPDDMNDMYQNIETRISEIRDTWYIEFVTGERSIDDEWDDFVQEVMDAGYEEYIDGLNQYAMWVGEE